MPKKSKDNLDNPVGSTTGLRVLNTIMNNIPAMVFYKDLNGYYIAANEMFCHQLNTTQAEIIGKTDFDFYPKETAQRYYDSDQKVIGSGSIMEGFEEEIDIDSAHRIYATRKVLQKDDNGQPNGIIGLVYDITQARTTERDLEESRSQYKKMSDMFRMMADNIPDLLWAKDLDNHYIFTNRAICEKLLNAVDTKEPIGKNDMFFATRERTSHPDNPSWHTFGEICRDTDDVVKQQKSPGRFDEYGNVKGEFLFLDVQKAPMIDDNGNMIGTVGSGRDISRQKQIENELHALDQRNQAIIKALPDLMFLFDTVGNYLECYASDSLDLLAPVEDLIGKNVGDLFDQKTAEKTVKAIKHCLRTDSVQTFEYSVELSSCTKHYEARFIKVDEKKVLCISRDITEHKRLQKDLVLAKERAEISARLKSTLLNNMSHEVRTPINGILGFAEILQTELKEPEYIEMASYIKSSGERLMKTLDSIMMLSQLESGIKELREDYIEVEQQLQRILAGFNDQVHTKGLYLRTGKVKKCDGYIDSYFFTQSITNILENAIKFTHQGGVIIHATIAKIKGNRNLTITIEDSGIGISEANLKLIFEEFRQASEGQNRSFEGPGLGLTIAVKMVQLLGGNVVVESTLGNGSRFIINLPFPQKPGKTTILPNIIKRTVSQTSQEPRKKELLKLLLVEDSEENAHLTFSFLKNLYDIDWALDGTTAIGMAKSQQYAAILMDINLAADMNGLTATRLIREIIGYEDTPIIALTGYTLFGDRNRLIGAGCTEYLPKPFTKSALINLINHTLTAI